MQDSRSVKMILGVKSREESDVHVENTEIRPSTPNVRKIKSMSIDLQICVSCVFFTSVLSVHPMNDFLNLFRS